MTEFDPIDASKRSLNLQDALKKTAGKDEAQNVADHENANDKSSYSVGVTSKKASDVDRKELGGNKTYDFSRGNGTLDELISKNYKGATESEKYAAAREIYRANSDNEELVNAVNDAYIASQAAKDIGLECFNKASDKYNPSALFYLRDLVNAARNGEDVDSVENLYTDDQTAASALSAFKNSVKDKIASKGYDTFDKNIKQSDIPMEFLDFADYSEVGVVDCPTITTAKKSDDELSYLTSAGTYTPENNGNSEYSKYYTVKTDPDTGLKTLSLNLDNFDGEISDKTVENIIATAYGLSDSNGDGNYSIHSYVGGAIKDGICKNEGNNDIFRDIDVNNFSTNNFVKVTAEALRNGASIVCPDTEMSIRSDYQMEELDAKQYVESETNVFTGAKDNAQRYTQIHITQESVELQDKDSFRGVDVLEYLEYEDGVSYKEALENAVINDIIDEGDSSYQSIINSYNKQVENAKAGGKEPENFREYLAKERSSFKNIVTYDSMDDGAKANLEAKVSAYDNLMLAADKLLNEDGTVKNVAELQKTKGLPSSETLKTNAADIISQELGNSPILTEARDGLNDTSKVKDSNITQLLNINIKSILARVGITSMNLEDANISSDKVRVAPKKAAPAAAPAAAPVITPIVQQVIPTVVYTPNTPNTPNTPDSPTPTVPNVPWIPTPTITPGPTTTPAPTITPGPTTTPAPTVTPGPTTTPAPTITPGPTEPIPTTTEDPGDIDPGSGEPDPRDPDPTSPPPVTDPPATDPPATDPPATDPPATDPPATDPPATDPPDCPPENPDPGRWEDEFE